MLKLFTKTKTGTIYRGVCVADNVFDRDRLNASARTARIWLRGGSKLRAVTLLLIIATFVSACDPEEEPKDKTSGGIILLDVRVPRHLTSEARVGQRLYLQHCAGCHGKTIGGSINGPPLIEYGSAHHSDETFYRAVSNGVKQHHWKYGDMPPVKGISSNEVGSIITFVREVQRFDERRGRELGER